MLRNISIVTLLAVIICMVPMVYIVVDIREINAEIEHMHQLMEVRGQSIAIARDVIPSSDAMVRSAQREAGLAEAAIHDAQRDAAGE